MINLSCPSCTAELEIDDGFRGGVCRCFDCGTLMTVPDTPGAGTPETLSRPDSPDSPGADDAQVYGADDEAEADYGRTGEFYTSSGKRVHLTTRQLKAVPVARKKRMGVRITVIALMVGIILSIMAGLVTGMVLLFKPPEVKSAKQITLDAMGGVDPMRNPFLLAESNFLSIPIPADDSTVIMVDSSSAMTDFIDITRHAVWASWNLFDRNQPLQIVFMREGAPIVIPAQMAPAKKIPRKVLLEKLQDLTADGGMAMRQAFDRVQRGVPPEQVFMAVRLLPPDAELDRLGKLIIGDKIRLIVIHIDAYADHEKLKQIAKDSGGVYVNLPAGLLRQWYKEYLQANGRPLPEITAEETKAGDQEPDADTPDAEKKE